MKTLKKALVLLLVFSLMLGISSTMFVQEAFASSDLKAMTIFANQSQGFNDSDYTVIANSNATDFVFIPRDATEYGSSETGYLTQLGPQVVDFINNLVAKRSNAKIWIGTPGISSISFQLAGTSLNPFYNYITYVKSQIGSTKWSNNIAGVYMNSESIYTTVNYNNLLSNTEIKLMNDLSYRVHTNLSKKFLWIPYYGYGSNAATTIKNLGYIANTTNIYDYVLIQPHYYFDSSVQSNLNGIYYSVQKQAVTYRDNVTVVNKTSNTIIGAEMEINHKITNSPVDSTYLGRYNEYVNKFSGFRGQYPFAYYWDGSLYGLLTNPGYLNDFYNY